jgi:pimeloyl-ACP methyl ester carboxylesterase
MSEPNPASRLVLIPGMGADHRLFDGIELPGHEVIRTNWIPHRDGEHLSTYAGRFAEHYGVGAADILIGVSMGGIVAGAMAQRVPPQRLILISSCSDIRQLSPLIAALIPMGPISPFELARLLPRGLMPAQRKLALEMFDAQDMAFIRWACNAVMEWTGAPRLPGTVTIHGTADRVFPIRRQPQVDVTIQGGGHLMVMDQAAEVGSAILRNLA